MTNPFATPPCPHEPAIVEAARSERPAPHLAAHLAVCPTCRDVHATVAWMAGLAAHTDRLADRRRLPNAGQLWWKAQLARRWEAEARAVAPLDMMQRVEAGVGVVSALVLLIALVRALAGSADIGTVVAPAAATGLLASYSLVIAAGVLLVAAASVVALHKLLD
jgi:predicted anti-sigma-YlaC factor YlaD